jgi:hypothetical protein
MLAMLAMLAVRVLGEVLALRRATSLLQERVWCRVLTRAEGRRQEGQCNMIACSRRDDDVEIDARTLADTLPVRSQNDTDKLL